MDHMMPKMDGVEATKIIRELGYNEPIVALTANAVAGQAEVFFKNGFDDFISKPIDIRRLNAVLNKLVRDKQPPEVIEEARRQAETRQDKKQVERRQVHRRQLNRRKLDRRQEDREQAEAEGDQAAVVAPQPSVHPMIAEPFARDARKSLAALDAIMEAGAPYSEDALRDYTIHTHGMKSALANIGKADLSAIAMKLEQFGRDGNIEIIAAETPGFLSSLRAYVDELSPLEEVSSDDGAEVEIDAPYLKEKLLAIKAACEEYDENAADNVLKELREASWPRQIKELLGTISERLLHSDFDEIVDDINKYVDGL
jgi:HPt (histidine-containing phosphotransfer) domain-containing protein